MNRNYSLDVVPFIGASVDIDIPEQWILQDTWPLLDLLREEGAVILLKLDGQRKHSHYTVVVSGEKLPTGEVIRTDRATIEEAVCFGVGNYAVLAWGLALSDCERPG